MPFKSNLLVIVIQEEASKCNKTDPSHILYEKVINENKKKKDKQGGVKFVLSNLVSCHVFHPLHQHLSEIRTASQSSFLPFPNVPTLALTAPSPSFLPLLPRDSGSIRLVIGS